MEFVIILTVIIIPSPSPCQVARIFSGHENGLSQLRRWQETSSWALHGRWGADWTVYESRLGTAETFKERQTPETSSFLLSKEDE
ncbi:hypothetical protein DAPPUDRAFT_238225 [Daphnia pulex]|uniref:Uncharacterized protein n=1 Tax=Daphnia pulex TaxID=6669 RepID=E9G5U5_DAPPU|nr:hypothetical protein DAPPUDRAFT_238225 [Daphnia pulex]|eukprot:EFX85110.1 hypothetical protein DAPPUDRAFT_238225 [Daphnia pulex]